MKEFKDNYNASDIDILDGLDPVRKRPAMYIGSTNVRGLHHLVWEIVDNAVDEAINGYGNSITVIIHKDGSVSVQDEGRGIPVDIHENSKKPAVEVLFTVLHSGGKFNSKAYRTSGGLHGVGASVTNALSVYCDVTIFKNGLINHIRFENGGKLVVPLEVLGKTKKHGTLVRFKPDPTIFPTVVFNFDTIAGTLQEKAFLLKGVHFLLKDERTGIEKEFFYERGISEYLESLNVNKTPLSDVIYFESTIDEFNIEVAFQYCLNDYNESIYSYANNIRTPDGGTHETGFKTAITKAVNDYAEEHNLLRSKTKLEGSDVREGLTAIISVQVPEKYLEYEGQTKTKLGTPAIYNVISNFVYSQMSYYLTENKEFAVNLVKKCVDAQNARNAARKAKEEARGTKTKKIDFVLSDKLTPAQSKDYEKNELFIVEGESAGGSARKGRDRMHQAILPLRGKPLNTDSVTLEKMKSNQEFSTIINTIGAGVGQNFDIDDAKYGKVIIMTDADDDDAHIQTLLLTFFYHFMRPLITHGKLFVACPPLYRVSKEVNHKLIYKYAWDNIQLEQAKKEIGAGYHVSRFKGLGEMNEEQLWESTMDPRTRQLTKVAIEDPLLAEQNVSILMGKDSSQRRKWVEEHVDFNEIDTFIEEVK